MKLNPSRSPSVVRRKPFCRPPLAVCRLPSAVSRLLYAVSCLLLAVFLMVGCETYPVRGHYYQVPKPEEVEIDGITYMKIPAGWFTMGSTYTAADDDEAPVHEVYLDAYYISKYEVTNAQYCVFLNAYGNNYQGHECIDIDDGDCQILESGGTYSVESGKDNYPVIEVTW
ncbi:SUMF1/EgtB/PvdO family nonheme iron enzyme, partial [candidate division WOR-3 bacterium]|nr:SUMF1/EgtB/PvdO family nonheme iron enzyme [candidate division WOR-3 bacterium]